jgi:hypothetical protein
MMSTLGHFVLPLFHCQQFAAMNNQPAAASKNLDSERNIKQGAAHLK